MAKSEISALEIEMLLMIKQCEDIIDDSYLTTGEARKIVDLLAKGVLKIEELRISRDNWKAKYIKLRK